MEDIQKLIASKTIENIDLSQVNVNGLNFSNCTLTNVKFATENQTERTIENVNFADAKLVDVDFSNATLNLCSFQPTKKHDSPLLLGVCFKKTVINNCRFRGVSISKVDFRYAEILNCTFEDAHIEFSDFYRAKYQGYNVFYYCKIKSSSVTTFFEGPAIRRENLVDGKILQEDENLYRQFLEWDRLNDRGEKAKFDIEKSLAARYEQAENIYRELSALWNSKGYFSDGNWAYICARRMERKKMKLAIGKENTLWHNVKLSAQVALNWFIDICFGYGESLRKILCSYIFLILLFSVLLYFFGPIESYVKSLVFSAMNMAAQTPEEISNTSFVVTVLNFVQSAFGIILSAIFGFVIANKIRMQ